MPASAIAGEVDEGTTEEEQCSVCWGLLCEPVSWPECGHHFCLLCSLRTRRRPKPACPLCRAEAPRTCKVTSLQVDGEVAARVRRSVGYSAYEAKRRELWSDAAKPPEELRATPILCTIMRKKKWRLGARLGLRLSEPRFREMVRRAMAPGGNRRFAAANRVHASGVEGMIAEGTCVRVCDIKESSEGDDGSCYVVIEAGSLCTVLTVTTEEISESPLPLVIGELEELEDQDQPLDEEDASDEGDDGVVVLGGEDREVELLHERLHALQVLHATMQLEHAQLEQRRLEYMMLLSQRRMLQELTELSTEITELAGLAVMARHTDPPSPPRIAVQLRRLAGMTAANSGVDQQRRTSEPQQEARQVVVPSRTREGVLRIEPEIVSRPPRAESVSGSQRVSPSSAAATSRRNTFGVSPPEEPSTGRSRASEQGASRRLPRSSSSPTSDGTATQTDGTRRRGSSDVAASETRGSLRNPVESVPRSNGPMYNLSLRRGPPRGGGNRS